MRYLQIILCLILVSCNFSELQRAPSSQAPSLDNETESGVTDPVEEPIEPPGNITQEYPFLQDPVFWERAREITPIPRSKRCRNTKSYAYFGLVRLVYNAMTQQDFSMFPFNSSLRYYRFLDKVEPSEPLKYEIFAQDNLYEKLLIANEETKPLTGRDLTLTGITKHNNFDHDLHCRHRGGNVIDMRPYPGTEPMTWRSKVYDREANLSFIKAMLSWDRVELIFFNDPKILNDDQVKQIVESRRESGNPVIFQRAGGHDNHIHIEFKVDEELDKVATYVFGELGFNELIYNFSDEYLYH